MRHTLATLLTRSSQALPMSLPATTSGASSSSSEAKLAAGCTGSGRAQNQCHAIGVIPASYGSNKCDWLRPIWPYEVIRYRAVGLPFSCDQQV